MMCPALNLQAGDVVLMAGLFALETENAPETSERAVVGLMPRHGVCLSGEAV